MACDLEELSIAPSRVLGQVPDNHGPLETDELLDQRLVSLHRPLGFPALYAGDLTKLELPRVLIDMPNKRQRRPPQTVCRLGEGSGDGHRLTARDHLSEERQDRAQHRRHFPFQWFKLSREHHRDDPRQILI